MTASEYMATYSTSDRLWKRFLITFIATLVLIGAISFSSLPPADTWLRVIFHAPHETQIILHPFDATKDVLQDKDYAIVFDGGSTGTRVHIFSFLIDSDVKQRKIILNGEHFFLTKPGLSSFSHNVSKAIDSIEPLVKRTLQHVPSLLARQTPLILKATAGLRLLPGDLASQLLDTVETRLKSLPFKVDDDAVSMLDDHDEGLFGWYTVNFLLDKLHNISESAATLDLGGGSTQVTFSTNDIHTLVKSPPNYIAKRSIEGEPEYIYTHSYLGNGLMSARQSILLGSVRDASGEEDATIIGDNLTELTYHIASPCFKSLSNGNVTIWKFNDHIFHITSDDSRDATYPDAFSGCYRDAAAFVDSSRIDAPEELSNREVYAMSYFYDRMKDIRVLKQESGYVKVRDYFLYAEHVCNGVIRLRKQSAFLCLDLTYIATYLHDGLGLPLHKDILLIKKLNGIEVSWALGAAINLFDLSVRRTL